jgi:hypothetical protein
VKRTPWIVAAALGLTVVGALPGPAAAQEDGGIEVVQVRKNFYMLAGAGGNIGVQIGSDGVVLVNAGSAQEDQTQVRASHEQVRAELRRVT